MSWPPLLMIYPTAKCVAVAPDPSRPPTFEIVSSQFGLDLEVEVATEAGLFDASARGHLRSDTNFFNSAMGRKTAPAIRPTRLYSRQSWQSTPTGPPSFPGATVTYNLPQPVWAALLATLGRDTCLYYRVIGRSAGRHAESITDSAAMYAPYIHVLDRTLRAMYQPPASPLGSLGWLRVEGNMVLPGRRSAVPASSAALRSTKSVAPKILRGLNVSGFQHRQPDWPTQEKLASKPRAARGSAGCPVAVGTDTCPTGHWYDSADITQHRLQEIASMWKAEVIRLPVNQEWVLSGIRSGTGSQTKTGADYLSDLDCIIRWANAAGMYVLLSLQVTTTGFNASLPDGSSILFWRMLASRYRKESGVMFDLLNEPQHPNSKYPYHALTAANEEGSLDLWHEWVRVAERVIHDVHPDVIIFASGFGGPSRGSDLSGYPVLKRPFHRSPTGQPEALPNLVYSAHLYPYGTLRSAKFEDVLGSVGVRGGHRARPLMQDHPIFLGEFGPLEGVFDTESYVVVGPPAPVSGWPAEKAWVANLLSYARALQLPNYKGLVGWTAWSWGDNPHLVRRLEGTDTSGRCPQNKPFMRSVGGTRIPTAFGELVKAELAVPIRPKG